MGVTMGSISWVLPAQPTGAWNCSLASAPVRGSPSFAAATKTMRPQPAAREALKGAA